MAEKIVPGRHRWNFAICQGQHKQPQPQRPGVIGGSQPRMELQVHGLLGRQTLGAASRNNTWELSSELFALSLAECKVLLTLGKDQKGLDPAHTLDFGGLCSE